MCPYGKYTNFTNASSSLCLYLDPICTRFPGPADKAIVEIWGSTPHSPSFLFLMSFFRSFLYNPVIRDIVRRRMHLRPDHAVRDLPTLHAFIRAHPLGVITTSLPSENFPTLQCSHIPWVLDSGSEDPEPTNGGNGSNKALLGILRGHIARANPQTKAILEAVSSDPSTTGSILGEEVLVIFTSPTDHYITPNFYVESKPATGKVAPTWNYAAVQVYGRARIYHSKDESTGVYLHRQLSDLAVLGEEGVMGFGSRSGNGNGNGDGDDKTTTMPWKIEDAPKEYIATLKKNIVGVEIEITRIEGRFKVSQERPVKDRGGVVEGLEKMKTGRARDMADYVKTGVLPR
jgi:transcriptional regulator